MSRKIIAVLLSALVLCAALAFTASCAEDANDAETQIAGSTAEQTAVESKDQPIGLVIGMGIGVVFFGLLCIVVLSMIMSAIVRKLPEKEAAKSAPAPAAPAASELSPEKRREVIAAVSAVIAEELGTDVSAIRVTSFKRV